MNEQEQGALRPGSVKVGDGITWGVGSDRYAATVTRVSESGKTIWFTDDEYKAAEGHEYYGVQKYEYTSVPEEEWVNPMGETKSNVKSARWSAKRNCYVYFGRGLSRGRHARQDPSF